MPGRKTPLIEGQFYHIFNRGVAKLPTFTNKKEYERALIIIDYYRFANTPLKLSKFLYLPLTTQKEILTKLKKDNDLFTRIHSFVLMFNHFPFTLEEIVPGGISKFMADFTNSYTRYINVKKDRNGALFQGSFKSVLIESEEQLLHLSRYHHLNPYTEGIVNPIQEILSYEYSSLIDFTGNQVHNFVYTELILSHFKSRNNYRKFVLNQRDYQRKLGMLKKLTLEKSTKVMLDHL